MKRFIAFLFGVFISCAAIAATVNWYVDGELFTQTTCTTGNSITPPTAPEKYGYTFQEWRTYTPLEYIKSTGTQYIDTEYIISDTSDSRVVIDISDKVSRTSMFGAQNGQTRTLIDYGNTIYCGVGANRISYTLPNDGERHVVNVQYAVQNRRLSVQIDQGAISSSIQQGSLAQEKNYYIGSVNGGSDVSNLKAKVYGVAIYQNDILVRDFIPVLDHAGTPCMYDRVSHQFFYNAGTGDFIAGPILSE